MLGLNISGSIELRSLICELGQAGICIRLGGGLVSGQSRVGRIVGK